jgi:hypothetical protein
MKGRLEIEQAIAYEHVRTRSDIPHPHRWIELYCAYEPLPAGCSLEPARKLTNINDRCSRNERE